MELIRGLHNIRPAHYGCVLTIGKFDGVHLGHQAVLQNVLNMAKTMQLPAAVMVFEPQPEELFTPLNAPARLTPLRDKYNALAKQGLQRLICVQFNKAFASQSAQTFIEKYLVSKLGVKFLVVGDDFRFGAKRSGDFELLKRMGHQLGFEVASTASFRMQDHRISSTAIRSALSEGDFTSAKAMLGHHFTISGKVVKGEQNGRTIGFPTANIMIKRHKSPVLGVFAVIVSTSTGQHKGVANVGIRPTLNGKKFQLEVHIFDFNKDLYGQRISVEFIAKIRPERKFANFQELSEQIKLDAQQAKSLLDIK